MKHEIPFTQFLLPDGRTRPTSIMVDDAEFEAWKKLTALGFRMTVELLRNGMVSQCIEDTELGDFDCVVTTNGPDVPAKLSKMLLRFDPSKAEAWRAAACSP
jgi:hypothetical protein